MYVCCPKVYSQWIDITPEEGVHMYFEEIQIINSDTIYFFGGYYNNETYENAGLILKTYDAGESWDYTKIYCPDNDYLEGPFFRGADFLNDSVFADTGQDGNVVVFLTNTTYHNVVSGWTNGPDQIKFLDDTTLFGLVHKGFISYNSGDNWEDCNINFNGENWQAKYFDWEEKTYR